MKRNINNTRWIVLSTVSVLFLTALMCPDCPAAIGYQDVTDYVQTTMGRMRYNRGTMNATYDVSLTNISSSPIPLGIAVVIDNISSPNVTVENPDGWTPERKPYFDYTTAVAAGQLDPGETSAAKTWVFHNSTRMRFSLSLSILAGLPQRVIEFPLATPDVVIVDVPTTVSVTVQIGADPELLMNQIHLLRLDDAGAVQDNLGLMYDDGTHGDALIGDGTFSTVCLLDAAVEGEIYLVIQAAYTAIPTLVWSDILVLSVIAPPSPELVEDVLATNAEASQDFEVLASEMGPDEARGVVLTSLQMNPAVQEAFLGGDGTTICVTYNGGLEGGILAGPPGARSVPDSNNGAVASFTGLGNPAVLVSTIKDNTCVNCDSLSGNAYTLEQVKNFDNKGFVYLVTHGAVYGPNPNTSPIVIVTGETASTFLGIPTSHLWDWVLGRVIILGAGGGNYWAFKPCFISSHCSSFPNTLVVASSCHSYNNLTNTTMADAFLAEGCGAYVGWSDTVSDGFATGIDSTFCARLADGDSVQQAFANWTLAQRTDPSAPNAVFGYTGDGDLHLPMELVENGGFETGDLSGWSTGFTVGGDFPEYGGPGGYWTATSERKVEGTYSARLGRFDQTYTQGLLGPPQPGDEPSGRDWMYQDVEIPAGSEKTLSFSYKVRTYDTAVWDWFDAFILSTDTGATLATIVSHAGKPGYDYGVYWECDWEEVTYDLTAFAGQTIRIRFDCRQDGWGDQNAVYIDKVSISCEN